MVGLLKNQVRQVRATIARQCNSGAASGCPAPLEPGAAGAAKTSLSYFFALLLRTRGSVRAVLGPPGGPAGTTRQHPGVPYSTALVA